MPRTSPYPIVLTAEEARTLTGRAAKYTRPYFEVLRAKMILLAAEGWSNEAIARSLRTRREVVSHWRKRFFDQRVAGLEDLPRSGRPRAFSPRGHRHRQSARL
jgi:transposase